MQANRIYTGTRLPNGDTFVEYQDGASPEPLERINSFAWGAVTTKYAVAQSLCLGFMMLRHALGEDLARQYAHEFAEQVVARFSESGFTIWNHHIVAWVASASRARSAEK